MTRHLGRASRIVASGAPRAGCGRETEHGTRDALRGIESGADREPSPARSRVACADAPTGIAPDPPCPEPWMPTAACYTPGLTAVTERSSAGSATQRAGDGGRPVSTTARRSLASRARRRPIARHEANRNRCPRCADPPRIANQQVVPRPVRPLDVRAVPCSEWQGTMELPKAYTPRDVEGAIYERWLTADVFAPDGAGSRADPVGGAVRHHPAAAERDRLAPPGSRPALRRSRT